MGASKVKLRVKKVLRPNDFVPSLTMILPEAIGLARTAVPTNRGGQNPVSCGCGFSNSLPLLLSGTTR